MIGHRLVSVKYMDIKAGLVSNLKCDMNTLENVMIAVLILTVIVSMTYRNTYAEESAKITAALEGMEPAKHKKYQKYLTRFPAWSGY